MLVLDVDPIELVRGKGQAEGLLDQYVNDRPYAASSFLSVALNKALRRAMTGVSNGHQELADSAIPFEAVVTPLPMRGGEKLVRLLFQPLGWNVDVDPVAGPDTGTVSSLYARARLSGLPPPPDEHGRLEHRDSRLLARRAHRFDGFRQVDFRGEALPADYCRALVSDDETDQGATADTFDLVREIGGKRLKRRKLAVIDATNVRTADRKAWIELARQWHALPVAIVFDPGIDVCIERNKTRPGRAFGGQMIQRMVSEICRGLGGLQREGFRQVWKLPSAASIDAATLTRQPLWTDKRHDNGPFDIIGDIRGCADELRTLSPGLAQGRAVPPSRKRRARLVRSGSRLAHGLGRPFGRCGRGDRRSHPMALGIARR